MKPPFIRATAEVQTKQIGFGVVDLTFYGKPSEKNTK